MHSSDEINNGYDLDQKRSCSRSPDVGPQGGYATNFGAGLGGAGRGVEGQIMTNVFKALVTRLVKSSKDLKLPENMVSVCPKLSPFSHLYIFFFKMVMLAFTISK